MSGENDEPRSTHVDAADYLDDARTLKNTVLRVTRPNGREIDIAAVPVGLGESGSVVWVAFHEGDTRAYTVTETAVRNRVRACIPDVELVDEEESRFRQV